MTGSGRQAGQAVVWVAVMLPFFLSVVGLAIDSGQVFSARRDLQDIADGAARAGSMRLDLATLRRSGGATVVLDAPSARVAAARDLATRGAGYSATIAADPQRITVEVGRVVPTSFLRIVGITRVTVTASGTAEPVHGIERGAAGAGE